MIKARASAAFATVVCAAGLLCGCDQQRPRHHVITAKVIDTIKSGEVRWNEDYKSGDPAKILSHFAADATVMTPGAPPAVGAAALKAMVAASLQQPHFHMTFTSEEVDVPRSGEFAAVRGAYTREGDDAAGAAQTAAGSYVALYKPAGDGRWLVSWLVLAPGGPTAGPAPAPGPAP